MAVGTVLKTYGYVELKPPSTLLMPGSLVYVRDQDPFVAGLICDPAASLGPAYKPRVSRTASTQISKLNGAHMTIGADALVAFQVSAKLEAVHSVEADLTNGVVYEIDDTDVLEHLTARTGACAEALHARLGGKFSVTMISSALVGDVTYTVNWRQDVALTVTAKVAALNALTGELGGEHNNKDTISAIGLVWGIRDDKFLAGLSTPSIDETKIPRGARALPSIGVAPSARIEVP